MLTISFFLISFCIILGFFSIKAQAAVNCEYSESIDLGEPIELFSSKDCVFDTIDNQNIMYAVTDGDPAILNVYNIDEKKLRGTYELPGETAVWTHIIDSKHRVYMIGSFKLYRYDPKSDKLDNLGRYSETETASFVMTKDEEDNLYIGTFPNAKIIKFDSKEEKFIDLGRVDEKSQYVRSIVYHKGYLYAGIFSKRPGKLCKIDLKDISNKEFFEVPRNDEAYKLHEVSFLYQMNMADDLLVIFLRSSSKTALALFDTEKNEFIVDHGMNGEYAGFFTSKPICNKAYFIADGKFYTLDTKRKIIEDYEFTVLKNDALFGCGWVELKNYPDFPGKTLASMDTSSGELRFYNMQTKKRMAWHWSDMGLKGGKIKIKTVERGPGGEIYMSGRSGQIGARYSPKNNSFTVIPIGGAEGNVCYKGKQYYGIYPGAYLRVYDPHEPISHNNPKLLGKVSPGQDRPFAMDAAEDKIFLGTISSYGLLKGAFAYYDLKTNEMKTIVDIVKNQSVMSITYKDGIIYGSTTVHGGLGSEPTEKEAKIFLYDVSKGIKLKEFSPKIDGIDKALNIGEIKFDENGKLWAVTGYTLFSVDPITEKVNNVLSFGKFDYNLKEHVWKPTHIRFDKNGYLYANLNGIKAINTNDMSYKSVTDYEILDYTIGEDNNFYFSFERGAHFKKIEIRNIK